MELVQGRAESVLNLGKRVEGFIVKVFLSDFVPHVLDGIQFGAMGWLLDQSHVPGNPQCFGLAPTGLIHQHDHKEVGEILRHLFEEDIHQIGICIRENQ
jgi:hypothetical protein